MHRLATTKDIVDDDKKAPQTGPSSLLCKASEALPPCIGLGGVTFDGGRGEATGVYLDDRSYR
jgi:hypothetical protein